MPRTVRGQITLLATVVALLTLLTSKVWAYFATQAGIGRGPILAYVAAAKPQVVVDAWQSIMVFEAVELIAFAAWVIWKVTGRLLRPVEAVRAELAVIDFSDLPTHISGPPHAHEFDRLCRTIDNTLERLHAAKVEQAEIAHRQRQFAFDVSHELRAPIAGLRAQLEEAQQDPCQAGLSELFRTTLHQVGRLQTIIDDVLCLARVQACPSAELRQVDLAVLVRTEIAQRRDQLPVQLRLTHDTTVNAVPTQISRLLANLLNNAQRHATHLVRVEMRATHATVELVVSDDGHGIAEADREQVFQRFTRLDDARRRDHDGTGLGLAIARDIAHAHHGTLSVEESDMGGARFVLQLPRARRREMGSR